MNSSAPKNHDLFNLHQSYVAIMRFTASGHILS